MIPMCLKFLGQFFINSKEYCKICKEVVYNCPCSKYGCAKNFLLPKDNVTIMQLAEVAIVLREIVDRCTGLEGSTFTLLPQKAKPTFRGYHISIKGVFSKEDLGGLRKIVEGHDLVMDIKSDSVVIYETRGYR